MRKNGCLLLKKLIENNALNPALKAQTMIFPGFDDIVPECMPVDVDLLFNCLEYYKDLFAKTFETQLLNLYHSNQTPGQYVYQTEDVNKRSLKNVCVAFLVQANQSHVALAKHQYQASNNMTDTMAALLAINDLEIKERIEMFADFYDKFKHDILVVNKWLGLQAQSKRSDTLKEVQTLMQHEAFDMKNPNKVYALLGGFCMGNPQCFHERSGSGYTFLKDNLEKLNASNPQIASKMVTPLIHWKKFDSKRQDKMQVALVALPMPIYTWFCLWVIW